MHSKTLTLFTLLAVLLGVAAWVGCSCREPLAGADLGYRA
jgi:hypothetical protein